MSAPPIVMNDQITGNCTGHLVPNPSSGVPQPAPPLPFAAPLTVGLATTVTIGGKAVALVGSQGFNTPPHVGLHPSDPFMVPSSQIGTVIVGSTTVLVEGKPLATAAGQATLCALPGAFVPSVVDVTVD